MRPTTQPGRSEFIAIATILVATVALSIDVMLPALGQMASEFGVEDNQRQLDILSLFVGLACSQLIFGPLLDGIGRRPAVALGAVVLRLADLYVRWPQPVKA